MNVVTLFKEITALPDSSIKHLIRLLIEYLNTNEYEEER